MRRRVAPWARARATVGRVREQGRVRQGGTDGIWQYASPPAMTHERRRGARSLPRRTPNRWEYSGRRLETAATERAGRPGSAPSLSTVQPAPPSRLSRRRPTRWSRRVRRHRRQPSGDRLHVATEHRPPLRIGTGERTDDDVLWCQRRQHGHAEQLPQAPLETIPRHAVLAMLRHDEPHSRERQRGSRDAELQMRAPHTLPLTPHSFQIRLSRETLVSRETERIRRRRTCSAMKRPTTCGPSCDDG